jgi:hypothetical protein
MIHRLILWFSPPAPNATNRVGRAQRSLLGLPVFNRVSAGSRGVASAVWAPANSPPPICHRHYSEVCSEGG